MIANGFLGELRLVRTLGTSGRRNRIDSTHGKLVARPARGLLELAVHHIDLIRFLTGLEIRDVYTQSRHDQGDDKRPSGTSV